MSNWQLWLTQNWDILSYWSKKWHRKEWRELMAHMAIYLQKNWSKFSKIPDGPQRIAFLQTWMKNMVKWENSEFNKTIRVNNLEEERPQENLEDTYIEYYDIISEDVDDEVKEWIIDLTRKWGEVDVRRLIAIRTVYLTLEQHEKVLYGLYFTKMLSLRQIAIKLDIPLSAVYGMVKDLKNKIKDQCGM
jgi:DNA-directed RNA polymerase specialized sigma subunit